MLFLFVFISECTDTVDFIFGTIRSQQWTGINNTVLIQLQGPSACGTCARACVKGTMDIFQKSAVRWKVRA